MSRIIKQLGNNMIRKYIKKPRVQNPDKTEPSEEDVENDWPPGTHKRMQQSELISNIVSTLAIGGGTTAIIHSYGKLWWKKFEPIFPGVTYEQMISILDNESKKKENPATKNEDKSSMRKPKVVVLNSGTTEDSGGSIKSFGRDLINNESRLYTPEVQDISLAYPQFSSFFTGAIAPTPAGLAGSGSFASVRFDSLFDSLASDINAARQFVACTTAYTSDSLRLYINVVAQAYFLYHAVGNHMSALNTIQNVPSLSARMSAIYNSSTAVALQSLRRELMYYYLPIGIQDDMKKFSKVYVADAINTPLMQFVPWKPYTNTAANFITIINDQIAELKAIAVKQCLNSAFSSPYYTGRVYSADRISLDPAFNVFNNSDFTPAVESAVEVLNVWTNMPVYATAASVHKPNITNSDSKIDLCVWGEFNKFSSGYTTRFSSGTSAWEPGYITPVLDIAVQNSNWLSAINTNGDDAPIAITDTSSTSGYARGSKVASSSYNTTDTQQVVVPGTTIITGALNAVVQDGYEHADSIWTTRT